ncbi:D-glycero-beta-D-manno-heptose 1,7-bisphosphate 7-phosphatase [Oceanisphaera pacifica]|uniref:D,D-heptose 1,7-bisphosphate phosphatase n=1 Tax=Oceanisphaera pacifica TaxID=2818389 RepID=A0ABS3NIJ4_9GAMM|nr:D-glycero-beta-D-manno-heptose 1,7-bisphosphate 7-phosphatase [Oceanisphaera pacifica]MBO1520345.1 D-glycero-beta-D-manno-heptose 1,7-bisphosphate 7-phosphatase [Oceanisphaera pacifica]
MSTAAIFLDRDGVINQDTGYVSKRDDFIFIDGVIDAMKLLKEKGYQLVIITNQSGIARGLFSEDDFISLTEWMDWSLSDRGVDLDGFYFCPHHPSEGSSENTQVCDCRKPAPGMFIDAIDDLGINAGASYMVGDKVSDLQAAQAAGVGHLTLVRTGKAITEEGEALADAVYPSLVEFAQKVATLA